MKIIYMNHTLNFMHLRGIDVEPPKNTNIRQEEMYVVIEDIDGGKETKAKGIQNADSNNGR